MKKRTKTDSTTKLVESEARIERVKLADNRDMIYEKFRTNIRLLRAEQGWSGVEASEHIGLKDGKRMLLLEYGRGTPSLEELLLLGKCFCVTIDDLLNKQARIIFS